MSDSTTRYVPRDWRRVCDVCGNLRNISQMHKQDELWVCTYDYGERVRTELDRGNARQRPFTIKPVPHAKPWDNYYPNLLETDDAAVFNFLAQQVEAQCRYELVQSGSAPYTSQGGGLPALSWAARYYYDLIIEGARTLLIPKARELLATIATYLMSRQVGFGLSPSFTRAANATYGGFLSSGTTYNTDDTSTSGLAMLYAYRIFGTTSYLVSARAAASFLRNVQAIGSNGTVFTSSNAAGTARLYTGSLASQVSSATAFDCNDQFYPSALLALEFWNELKLTDGDQSIGATAAVSGFDSTPSQLLSTSITDLRTCWEVGITDADAVLVNGLSTTTPKEFFNAYPAVKPNFSAVIGTGMWEYVDGGDAVGTQISGQNFATALSALYNYEGATSQVTTISDWLRTFTSNPEFETADDTSTFDLYHATTGTYDPTATLATLLQVRDPDDFAATAINASSLYDWGAFGLLSRLWASRYTASFRSSRLFPLNTVQRFYDGNNTDTATDRIILRGVSGLTMQSGFSTNVDGSVPGSTPYAIGTIGSTTPTMEGLSLWLKGDVGLSPASGTLTLWQDQAGQGQDIDVIGGFLEPQTGVDTINGIPCVTFPIDDNFHYAAHSGNLKKSNGVDFAYTDARTIFAVIKPRVGDSTVVGGPVFATPDQPNFECLFDVEQWFTHSDAMFIFDNIWKLSGYQILAPDTTVAAWDERVVVAEWKSAGYPNLAFAMDGGPDLPLTDQAGNPTTDQLGGTAVPPGASFVIGNCWNNGGGIQEHNFHGAIAEILVYDYLLTGAARTTTVDYLGRRYTESGIPDVTIACVNDALRAAQFGRSFREARS